MTKLGRRAAFCFGIGLSLMLTACGGGGGGTTTPVASISSFAASSSAITAGASTNLTFEFSNGTGVITPGNLPATSGSPVSVSPAATTVYTLTVTAASGTAVTQTVTVTVDAPPEIGSFTAASPTITAGASTNLTFSFTGGTGVITPGNLPATSGTAVSVTPATTTQYTLSVTNPAGTAITQAVTVTVDAPPEIGSFTAASPIITAGASTNLTFSFTGGTGVITPGNLPATSGTAVSVTPAATTQYTLTVTNPAGTAITQAVTVTVDAAPEIGSFAAASPTILAGASTNLTFSFTGGTGVITPGNLPATSGTAVSVTPAATTQYTLTVTNPAGTAITQAVTVTVDAAPAITSFAALPATIGAGQSTNLTGVFANGAGVITPGNLSATSGTAVSVSPTITTTYTLTVTPPLGAAITQTFKITVVPAPTIALFAAVPATIGVGESTTLTGAFANGTGTISATGLSVAATSGSGVSVSPTTTTVYTLTVTPTVGMAITQNVTVSVIQAPAITSFAASPASIAGGSGTSLTAIFANGTGVITPGGISVISGNAVSVSPTATTAYTLTVTPANPANGSPASKMATVTVTGTTITSFSASSALIASGSSTNLTGVFAGGTGVITPGNLPAISGAAVSVNPTVSTVYTLTVTPASGTPVTKTTLIGVANAVVAVDQLSAGLAVTDQILGMNLPMWYDVTSASHEPVIEGAFHAAGIKAVRWPGGSNSDAYNWETNTECGGGTDPNDDFTDFVNKLVIPAGLDLALTADYGTGKNCTGAGDPTEAAAWAAEAVSLGVPVSHMTVGNEEYGSWEIDNHASQHNATTYAAAVAGANGYYALIKAASPNTLVGVDVDPGYAPWDQDVMSGAPYDFVEYHYYPETPGQESDIFLVQLRRRSI